MSKPKINDPKQIKKMVEKQVALERESLSTTTATGGGTREPEYYMRNGFLCRNKVTKDGDVPIKLCNFEASITAENVLDNGLDQTTFYEIEAKLHGTTPLQKLEVSASSFPGMTWISKWGAGAVLEPGQTVKDFVRHAIQITSRDIKKTVFYAHTGWRTINERPLYLHGGGAVGADAGISIKLPEGLERYALPAPPEKSEQAETIREAIQTSLSFLDIGKREIMLPLFAITHLAPLTTLLSPNPNFSAFVYGQSGTLKTSIVLIMLNYYGDFPGSENLSNFDDTDGSLELRAFALKDCLHVVDDYHPSSNKQVALQREARLQKIVRCFGNRTARHRLNSDLTIKKTYPPRSMLVVTGEEAPGLQSTIARLLTIEISDGDISKNKLSALQEKHALLPHAMRHYLEWIQAHMQEIVTEFPRRFRELRAEATRDGLHGRLPEQAAFLQYSLEKTASWLVDSGILSESGADDLLTESWAIFHAISKSQQRRIEDDNPITLFFDILSTLISQQNLRLCPTVTGGGETVGAGEVLGWYDDSFIYLDSAGAWHSLQRFCISEGTHFPFGKNTFFQMLKNKGIIQASPTGECTIVKTIGTRSCRVLKILDRGFYQTVISVI